MAINFNNLNQGRVGIIGLDNVIAQPSIATSQQAGLLEILNPFSKSDEEKALEQIQDLREQENKITGGVGASEDVMQNLEMLNPDKFNKIKEIQKQIEELKQQFPDDTAVQEASLTNQFGFPLTASLDTSGVAQAIEKAKAREELDNRKFMSGFISQTTTDPMDIREQNRLGNLAANELFISKPAVTFDAPYMSTGLKMVPKPTFGQRLSSGINQLKTNLGTGFGKVKSDIGSFIGSGGFGGMAGRAIGGILQALLPKESPIDKFNKQFSVQNLGGDPYGYYNDLRAGNLTGQDPFGVNTVSGFGNYQKHYSDYLNAFNNQTKFKGLYTPKKTSKFAQDKADFAKEVLGLKKTSSNITGTPLIVSGSVFEQDSGRDDGPKGGFSTEKKGKEGAFGTFGEGRGRKDF